MKNTWIQGFTFLFLISILACTPKIEQKAPVVHVPKPPLPPKLPAKAKNVIFLIGDGMGLTQISAAMMQKEQKLNLTKFKHIGFHNNPSADDLITDSAAGATAFSIGKKAKNGGVGVDAKNKPHETLIETAIKKKMATGLLATSTITHATPASFAAHWKTRADHEEIALQMSKSGVDIMVGGGLTSFTSRDMDSRNLLNEMTDNNYSCESFIGTSIQEWNPVTTKKHLYLTANGSPLPFDQGRDYLRTATAKSLRYLSEKGGNGFFVMIEGSQIDWGGHSNTFGYVMAELYEFDDVIGMCLDFAKKDGETLVIVTADHETGGLTILKGSTKEKLKVNFSSDYHTAQLIPVFAYGPGAELFQGIYENTDIYTKIREALIWDVGEE